jgi:5-methylcytosine-specific restriction protein A
MSPMTARRTEAMPDGWPETRLRILKRDRRVCYLCRRHGAAEVDHVIPVSRGGSEDDSNLAAIHARCHRSKTAREARGEPRRRPAEQHPGAIGGMGSKSRRRPFSFAPLAPTSCVCVRIWPDSQGGA